MFLSGFDIIMYEVLFGIVVPQFRTIIIIKLQDSTISITAIGN